MLRTTANPTILLDRAPGLLEPVVCGYCDASTSEAVLGNDPDGFILCRACLARLDTILSSRRQLAT